MADKDVVPPVVMHQEMPRLSRDEDAGEKSAGRGDRDRRAGTRDNVTVRQSMHRCSTRRCSRALATGVISRPSQRKPVRYRKMIQINVSPEHSSSSFWVASGIVRHLPVTLCFL